MCEPTVAWLHHHSVGLKELVFYSTGIFYTHTHEQGWPPWAADCWCTELRAAQLKHLSADEPQNLSSFLPSTVFIAVIIIFFFFSGMSTTITYFKNCNPVSAQLSCFILPMSHLEAKSALCSKWVILFQKKNHTEAFLLWENISFWYPRWYVQIIPCFQYCSPHQVIFSNAFCNAMHQHEQKIIPLDVVHMHKHTGAHAHTLVYMEPCAIYTSWV